MLCYEHTYKERMAMFTLNNITKNEELNEKVKILQKDNKENNNKIKVLEYQYKNDKTSIKVL